MPVVAAPNLIEQSDFSRGWMPDAEPAHIPANALQSSLNLLPAEPTKSLRTRYGFHRVLNGLLVEGYEVKAIFPYPSKDGGATYRRLILFLSNEASEGSNVRIYEYNLRTGEVVLVNQEDIDYPYTWANSGRGPFYGVTIDGIFYGGASGETLFSWDGETYDYDATTITAKTFDPDLKIANCTSNDFQTKWPKDFAFMKDTIVSYEGRYYKFIKKPDHRFNDWDPDKTYQVGNMVTRRATWDGGAIYRCSFRCVKKHKSDAGQNAENAPGTGSDWKTYWRKVFTPAPVDEEGDIRSNFWAWIPRAQATGHGIFHGQRLWLRADDGQNYSTLQYSGVLKYEDFGTKETNWGYDTRLEFDPSTAFATGDTTEGGSGGMQPFGVGDGDAITALLSYNSYLLVFKRFSTWVLSGLDESTWTVRKLADVGAASASSVCEHEGLVYFVGDKGVYLTDGNSIQMAQGLENISTWMREKLKWGVNTPNFVLWSYDGFLWISFPMYGGRRNTHSLAYYPADGSWWLTTLNASAAATLGNDGSTRLFFAKPTGMQAAATEWDGDPYESTSTATIGEETFTNLLKNPGFEMAGTGEMPKHWDKDSASMLDARRKVGADAAYEGNAVLRVVNTSGDYHGCTQTIEDADTSTHTMSMFVKHKNVQGELRKPTYTNFRLRIGNNHLPEEDHTYLEVGDGWWKVSATYTGSTSPRKHGFDVLNNGHLFLVDKVMVVGTDSPPPSFDGDGSDNGEDEYEQFGSHAVLFEYDPEDMDEENPTDDYNVADEQAKPIVWGARTAWFPFGTANQQRRVRRIWNMLRGNGKVWVRAYRDYRHTAMFEQRFDLDDDYSSYYVEGVTMPDSSAICIEVEGEGGPGVFAGTAIDTEPRRYRYHKNNLSSVGEVTPAILTESGDYLVP